MSSILSLDGSSKSHGILRSEGRGDVSENDAEGSRMPALVHGPQGGAPVAEREGVEPGPEQASGSGPRRSLRNSRRGAARQLMAEGLAYAMAVTRTSSGDVGAAWDMDARDVREVRAGERVFEAGCLRLLPDETQATLLAWLVAQLPAAARASFDRRVVELEAGSPIDLPWEGR